MNYSHDNWSAILAHIGKPEELDTSARNAGALTRRREIRDAATLLRLGLAYGPGGMSLREVTAWAQLHDVATLSDVALLKRLRNAADWFGILQALQALRRRRRDDRAICFLPMYLRPKTCRSRSQAALPSDFPLPGIRSSQTLQPIT